MVTECCYFLYMRKFRRKFKINENLSIWGQRLSTEFGQKMQKGLLRKCHFRRKFSIRRKKTEYSGLIIEVRNFQKSLLIFEMIEKCRQINVDIWTFTEKWVLLILQKLLTYSCRKNLNVHKHLWNRRWFR